MKRFYLITLFLSLQYATNFDLEDGYPIRQGVHIEWYRTVSPGFEGESIFVWSDTRYGMRNIFAHKINQNGDLLWGETGAVVTNLPGRQEDPVSITDGSGGVYIAWVDYRFDAQGDIFIQHLDNNGNILMDENGIALAQVPGKQISINMCTDSLGGVFVTWQDKRGGVDDDIYGTHISSSHDIVNPGSGVPIVVEGGNQNAKSIEYAGNNEAFIAWADFREGANADIYGQRLDVELNGLFDENGLQVAGSNEQELKPRVTYVSDQRSFLVWKQGDENSKLYYQFIDSNGLLFDENKRISLNDALQTAPRVKRSKQGEIFVNWKDLRNDPINGDQYFQRINTSGEIMWEEGVRLDLTDDVDFSARFSSGINGDVNVIWERGTFPDVDILFQNINSEGLHSLSEPIFISNHNGYQFSPILTGNVDEGLFAIYADQGTGSINLVVQLINNALETQWENNGIQAMTGLDGDVNYTQHHRLSDEDFILTWEDNRASKKLYGSRITNSQNLSANGIQLTFSDNSSSETDFSIPSVLKTESSIYTATFDGSSAPKFVRINKQDFDLNNLWPDSGIALSPVFDMRNAQLIDTEDGIGCIWSESRGFNYDLYYQRIDNEGQTLLGEGGVEIVASMGDDYLMDAIPTPDGKFMIFWMEDAWPAAKLMFTKIDVNGNGEIGWNPNGINLSNSQFDSRNLQVKKISDNSGLMAIWIQDGNFSDIYAQKIDWDGNILWEDGGLPISTGDNDQVNISFDFNENITKSLITWEDYRNGLDFDIYGQVIDLENGELVDNLIQFTNDTTSQFNPVVHLIVDNEFIVIWEDERGFFNEDPLLINGGDLYGSGYIFGQGLTTEINGIPICIAYHKQQSVNITKHINDEYFLDWIDYRSSGKEDLANYYGKTLIKGELLSNANNCFDCVSGPNQFTLHSAFPNPFNGVVNFKFFMPENESVTFKIFDLNGRVITEKLILPGIKGEYSVNWNGKDMYGNNKSSGIYFYQFVSKSSIYQDKITYLK